MNRQIDGWIVRQMDLYMYVFMFEWIDRQIDDRKGFFFIFKSFL